MDLAKRVAACLDKAKKFNTKLTPDIMNIDGMSGFKTRIFYNEICSMEFDGRDTEYLEVGTWKGSTLCSALYENPKCRGTAIENWSLFGGPRDEFEDNLKRFNLTDRVQIIEEDIFKFDISKLTKPVDVYLYDGDHDEINQYKGITHMWAALADQAIIMVDDWNWPGVRKGTLDGLRDVGANVIEKFEIKHTDNDAHTPLPTAHKEFWNGIGIFVISKI